jgi:hypothetical protein
MLIISLEKPILISTGIGKTRPHPWINFAFRLLRPPTRDQCGGKLDLETKARQDGY